MLHLAESVSRNRREGLHRWGRDCWTRGKLCDRPQTPDQEVGGAPLASLPLPSLVPGSKDPECFQAQGVHQPLLVPLGIRLHTDSGPWPDSTPGHPANPLRRAPDRERGNRGAIDSPFSSHLPAQPWLLSSSPHKLLLHPHPTLLLPLPTMWPLSTKTEFGQVSQ